MYKIEIFDKVNHHLIFDLNDIISLLNIQKYSTLKWNVLPSLELYNGNKDLPQELRDFYGKIMSSKKPMEIHWGLINFIAKNVLQIINGTFIGKDESNYIEITAHDSTLWFVKTNDVEVYEIIKNRFKEVKAFIVS